MVAGNYTSPNGCDKLYGTGRTVRGNCKHLSKCGETVPIVIYGVWQLYVAEWLLETFWWSPYSSRELWRYITVWEHHVNISLWFPSTICARIVVRNYTALYARFVTTVKASYGLRIPFKYFHMVPVNRKADNSPQKLYHSLYVVSANVMYCVWCSTIF